MQTEKITALEAEAKKFKHDIQAHASRSRQRLQEIIRELRNIQAADESPESFTRREAIDTVSKINAQVDRIKAWQI